MKFIFIITFTIISYCVSAQWIMHQPIAFGGDTTFQPQFYSHNKNTHYCVTGRTAKSEGFFRVNSVYKTDDGGRNWLRLISSKGPTSSLYGIEGFGVDTLIVALGDKKLIRTVNGGASWDTVLNEDASLIKVGSILYALTSNGIFSSQDAGKSFYKKGSEIGLYFKPTSQSIAFMFKTDNKLYRSIDSCKTWNECTTPEIGLTNLNSTFSFPSDDVIYAKVLDKMYRSDDAGDSWKVLQTFSRSININSEGIYFINAKDGFHAFGGEFFKTNDSGRTWCVQPPSLNSMDFLSIQTYVMHFENDSLGIWANGGAPNGMTIMTTTNQGGPPCPSDTTIKGLGAELGFNQLKVFPNPSTGLLTLALEQGHLSQVQLFSMEGRLVFTQKLSEQEVTLQLPAMSPGIYMIEVQSTANKVFRQKLVIE